jgi:hypothetical protein
LIYTSEHEIKRLRIQTIRPEQIATITHTWTPREGEYYLAFRLDPDGELDELIDNNNLRIEPVLVGEKLPEEDPAFYYTYLLVVVLIVAWLVIYYKYRRGKQLTKNAEDSNVEPANVKGIKRPGYQRPRRRR